MTTVKFAPGCALMLYKPELAEKILSFLKEDFERIEILTSCCHRDPELKDPSLIINVCPGCDKRFRADYANCSTVSLWEILAGSESFPFPDYNNCRMTVVDACPTRDQERVHIAVRELLKKMNISLVEPEKTGLRSTCCGDSFYGTIPVEKVKLQMIKKANELPVNDVVVYCVSCTKSMFIGGRAPHYLIDLLFNEMTLPKTLDPDAWHDELNRFIELH